MWSLSMYESKVLFRALQTNFVQVYDWVQCCIKPGNTSRLSVTGPVIWMQVREIKSRLTAASCRQDKPASNLITTRVGGERTWLTKMSSPSSLSPSAMSDSPAPGSSVAGKGGGFRSELAAIIPCCERVWRRRKLDGAKKVVVVMGAAIPAGGRAIVLVTVYTVITRLLSML